VRAWLVKQGFEPGDLRSVKKASKNREWVASMMQACEKGKLNVCKWLYNHGAVKDISFYEYGSDSRRLMHVACENGDLPMVKWLFEEGAAQDIDLETDEWYMNETPMGNAYQFRNKPTSEHKKYYSLCKWLVLNGALNRRCPPFKGHIDRRMVIKTAFDNLFDPVRSNLIAWTQGAVSMHRTFLHVVLRASVVLPASQQHAAPDDRCRLPRLFRTDHLIMRRVGSFLGLETGRRLRNAREYGETLVEIKSREAAKAAAKKKKAKCKLETAAMHRKLGEIVAEKKIPMDQWDGKINHELLLQALGLSGVVDGDEYDSDDAVGKICKDLLTRKYRQSESDKPRDPNYCRYCNNQINDSDEDSEY